MNFLFPLLVIGLIGFSLTASIGDTDLARIRWMQTELRSNVDLTKRILFTMEMLQMKHALNLDWTDDEVVKKHAAVYLAFEKELEGYVSGNQLGESEQARLLQIERNLLEAKTMLTSALYELGCLLNKVMPRPRLY